MPTFEVTVNGVRRDVSGAADTTLLHVLRDQLGLVGSRFGCGLGLCGACFVLLDGRPAPACDVPLWSAAGKDVTTVEGLDGHALQQAFLDEQAAQCGYCVSGILVTAAALLAENPHPDEDDVVTALDRHLCRCGAQRRMVAAVLRAAILGAAVPRAAGTGAAGTGAAGAGAATDAGAASGAASGAGADP